MRFLHLADLHIGKRVNEFSMIKDQRYILGQVLLLMDEKLQEPKGLDGVLIAGDIYDKTIPTAEAVQLLDWFLTEIVQRKLCVYMVSGNHDSGERLAFGAHLLEKSGVYLKSVYDGDMTPISLQDAEGTVNLYMLPFVKPIHVKRALSDCLEEAEENDIESYQDAVETVLSKVSIDKTQRNILIAHQMVTGAQRCDSEEIAIGGLDNIDFEVFDDFDYVALGHLHGPQRVGRDEIRYAGTLLKYSFSECQHKKSVTIVELSKKGDVFVDTVSLKPLRDMREIRGRYEELMTKDYYKDQQVDDYLRIILTDEEEIPDVLGRLRTVYPNIMKLEYDNRRTRERREVTGATVEEKKHPLDYLKDFYELQNNQILSEEQEAVVSEWIEKIWG